MKRIPIGRDHELRVLHRRGSSARGVQSIVLAIHHMHNVVGMIAVPVALFDDFQKAIAGLSIADIRPAPATPSGGEGANPLELAASGLTAHTAGAAQGQP